MDELIEQLADAEHASWARWMDYLFSKSQLDHNGTVTIPPDLAYRWRRQAGTPYADLSEREKESDRAEVRVILPFIEKHIATQAASIARLREALEDCLDRAHKLRDAYHERGDHGLEHAAIQMIDSVAAALRPTAPRTVELEADSLCATCHGTGIGRKPDSYVCGVCGGSGERATEPSTAVGEGGG